MHFAGVPAQFGDLLHHGWIAKRKLDDCVSNPFIDERYEAARKAGALGAKLTGAGGGGAAIGLARDQAHAREIAEKTGGFAVGIGT